MFKELEDNEPQRIRDLKDGRYLSGGLVNAYLDERLKPSEKKAFESLVGDMEKLKEELQTKTKTKEFISELIPRPLISSSSTENLKVELSEITQTVIGKDKVGLSEKLANFLDKTVLEF